MADKLRPSAAFKGVGPRGSVLKARAAKLVQAAQRARVVQTGGNGTGGADFKPWMSLAWALGEAREKCKLEQRAKVVATKTKVKPEQKVA